MTAGLTNDHPPPSTGLSAGAMPDLAFAVLEGTAEPHAAVPTLRLALRVESRNGVPVRSVMLNVQLRVDAPRRPYDSETQRRLAELFGNSVQWGKAMRSLYWTHATVVVPPFDGSTEVTLLVPCTYDFEVTVAKYFHGLRDGDIPLDLLFSGSVFYTDGRGLLQTTRISWEAEAPFRLPVSVWRDMMDLYYPESTWLRVRREAFDRLYAFRMSQGLTSWEETLDALLPPDPSAERR